MRILLAHNFYRTSAPSGEDTAFMNERAMLQNADLEVESFEKYNDDLVGINAFSKLKLGLSNSWSYNTYEEMQNSLKKFKPDIVHFHNTFPQITPSAYAACKDLGIPVIQTLHNFRLLCANALLLRDGKICELCVNGSMISALKYRCYRNSFAATASQVLCIGRNRRNGSYDNNVDRYVTLTEFAKKKFIEAGFNSSKIVTRPNFLSDPPEVIRVSNRYAIFVGRLTAEKGVMTLLKAWNQITGIELRVVGDGDLSDECKKYVEDNHINVKFLGFLPRTEVISAIQEARFLVFPSECYEGMPLTLLEAFACGTPVLVSNIGGQAEIVTDGSTGIYFETGDADDLAIKCNKYIANNELLSEIGAKARIEFDGKYSQRSVLQQTLSIYHSVLQ